MSKIEKDEDWVDGPSRRLKMIFEVILKAKLGFEIFCPATITEEKPTLKASRALLTHILFLGKTKLLKIEKDEDRVDEPYGSSFKVTFEVIIKAK